MALVFGQGAGMLGAIAGDIIGSVHEFRGLKTTEFPLFVAESRFTDDTVLSVAVADCYQPARSTKGPVRLARLWCCCPAPSKFSGPSQRAKVALSAGHSLSTMEYHAVFRLRFL